MSRTVQTDQRGSSGTDAQGGESIVSGLFVANDTILINVDYDNDTLDQNVTQRVRRQDWLPSSELSVAVTVGHVMLDVLDRVNGHCAVPFQQDSLKITVFPNMSKDEMARKKLKSFPRLVVIFSPKDTVLENKAKKAKKKKKKAKVVIPSTSALMLETTLDSGDLSEGPATPGDAQEDGDAQDDDAQDGDVYDGDAHDGDAHDDDAQDDNVEDGNVQNGGAQDRDAPDRDDTLQSSLKWLKETVQGLKGSVTALEYSNAEHRVTITEQNASIAALETANSKLQHSHAELKTTVTELRASVAALEDANAKLQHSNAELKTTITEQQASITAIESSNTKLQRSNAELKATLDSTVLSLTKVKTVLMPIYRRFLLDTGRDKICKCLNKSWSALETAAAAQNENLKDHIHGQRTSIPLCPSLPALGLLCEPDVIRWGGNATAHTTTYHDTLDAVWDQDCGATRAQLEEIYKLVYERDIDAEQFDHNV